MSADTPAQQEAALCSQIATALVGAVPVSAFCGLAAFAFAAARPFTVPGLTPTAPGVAPEVYGLATFVAVLAWATWMVDTTRGYE